MSDLIEKIKFYHDENQPFVVYNKPDEDEVIGIFQENNYLYEVNDFTEKGFVFASFDGEKNILIPEDKSEIIIENWVFDAELNWSNAEIIENQFEKNNFMELVQNVISKINQDHFYKVVLSRKQVFELKTDFISIFKNMLNAYSSAFTYCFYHPKVGLWLGAFSEQLLKVKDKVFTTMAVAGTQKYDGTTNVVWQEKEKNEQQFVTNFILKSISESAENIEFSEPYTLKAGNLLHIKTDINGKLKYDSLKDIVLLLHPTPAVCGLPKEKARQYILENEKYDREFYAGFLGELNKNFSNNDNETNLFVNLRCMKIENNYANLYLGCGITKDSIPEKEWTETVNKARTMANVSC